MLRIALLVALLGLSTPAIARTSGMFYAAPDGVDNSDCSPSSPCSPQGAVLVCKRQGLQECVIQLSDGIYLDPGINIHYYRAVIVSGNCAKPGAVVLRATENDTALVWVQDHAIGVFECLRLDATGQRVIGISGRQFAIIDYRLIDFGETHGGHHLAIAEHSIASCTGPNTISGGANVHASVSDMSKLNVGCPLHLSVAAHFNYFLNAVDFSKINAQGAVYSGEISESTGIKCNAWRSSVYAAFDSLPGDKLGTCDAPWR